MLITAPRVDREPARVRARRVAVLGNPNTGKTTVFNLLCGARAKTSNFPGTTTAVRTGRASVNDQWLDVLDLPGVYDFGYACPETQIARDVCAADRAVSPDALVVVVDACNLTRNLVLVGQLLACRLPTVVAVNMLDLAERRGIHIDAARLSQLLSVTVIPMVARTAEGLPALRTALAHAVDAGRAPSVDVPAVGASTEVMTAWALGVAAAVMTTSAAGAHVDTRTERLDRIFTHRIAGLAVFGAIAGLLFYALFTLATIPMDLIEATFTHLGDLARRVIAPGALRDLLTDGVVGGVAGTVVFLPQICLLFFFISLLEDTGYLARAAFVMDRLLSRFGLPGHSFVPLLTAHACALPGIISARLIPNRRDRLATILIAPFMSCSARLPVYVLLTSLMFPHRPAYAAAAFFGCYLLGASAGLLTAVLFGKTVLKGRALPMVLELPSYKVPSLRNAIVAAKDQGLTFLRTAGTIITAICVVMWWLSAYPRVSPTPEAQALRAQGLVQQADAVQARAEQAGSFAGQIGRVAEPVFRPLGFDWQLTVGVLTSYVAREVFVSTMSVLAGEADVKEVNAGVIARIRGMTRDDGSPVFTPATAAATLVFFVLAMQCLPTLAVTRRETGATKYAVLQFAYMSTVAYACAFVVHHALRLAGVS